MTGDWWRVFKSDALDALVDQALANNQTITAARAALKAALSEHARASIQREQRDRLAAALRSEPIELPYLFTGELGPDQLQSLADVLEHGVKAA